MKVKMRNGRSLGYAVNSTLFAVSWFVLIFALPLQCQHVSSQFFGMHVSVRVLQSDSWPSVPFTGIRLWDTKTGWAQLNPSSGSYDWHVLDRWLTEARRHDVDVLYTFGHTPQWASSNPSNDSCGYEPGACAPPNDLQPDGSGSDQHWKDFVTAIAKHSAGRIKYWEIWNEPINRKMWIGTTGQLLRMAKDASVILKSVDPDAIVLTPTFAMGTERAKRWTNEYLAAGGGDYADVVSYHAYLPLPEDVLTVIEDLRSTLSGYGQGSKPLWQTEGSWGRTRAIGFDDPDEQNDYVLRMYSLLASNGVARFYWYAWDNPGWGTMWLPAGLQVAGRAYETVHNWLIDSTFDGPCKQQGNIWTCELVRDGNRHASIVWTTEKGRAIRYVPPTTVHTAHGADGTTHAVAGAVLLSTRPVLLE